MSKLISKLDATLIIIQEKRYRSMPDIFKAPYFSANKHTTFATKTSPPIEVVQKKRLSVPKTLRLAFLQNVSSLLTSPTAKA